MKRMLFSYSACNNMLTIYESEKGYVKKTTFTHNDKIESMLFSSDYKYFASIAKDGNLRVFQWPDLTIILNIYTFGIIKASRFESIDSADKASISSSVCRARSANEIIRKVDLKID
jgi:WD40 repeat protein